MEDLVQLQRVFQGNPYYSATQAKPIPQSEGGAREASWPPPFHGNTMKLFCQRANDDFMALWITALSLDSAALLYTHSTIEQIAQKCRMTTKKTGNASKYALSKELFSGPSSYRFLGKILGKNTLLPYDFP